MKHRILCLVLLLIILVSSILPVAAADGIMPRFNNTAGVTTNFTISTTGKATISAGYNAYPNYFTAATVQVTLKNAR